MRKSRIVAGLGVISAMSLGLTGIGQGVADASTSLKTVTVAMSAKSVTLSTGTSLHAGRYMFKVASVDDDTLQLLVLRAGYSEAQADKDFGAAFGGNVAAVKRIDNGIRFFGGVEAVNHHAGYFVETLYAGTYYFSGQNSNVRTKVHVFGTPPAGQAWVNSTSTLVANKSNRWAVPTSIPRSGWTLFRNEAAEPHFIVLQQVQPSTTYRQVVAALKSSSQAPPSWALPGTYSTAVVSPGAQMLFHYSLPAGKYVMLCYWPDDATGMPHALMGMYKFITLT